jgi:hypothetical protein
MGQAEHRPVLTVSTVARASESGNAMHHFLSHYQHPDGSAGCRRGPRHRPDGQGAFSCQCRIRDITETDAHIVIPAGLPLPSEIYLINLRSQTADEAEVIWRHETEAGLRFISTVKLPILENPNLEYLSRIWRANLTRLKDAREP